MPGFRIHITGSSIIGAGYGAAAWYVGGMPPSTCLLASGLCGISGMMPDLDSGPGIPLRESVGFAAAVVPLMLVHRLHTSGLQMEALILLGAAAYLGIRFGVAWLIKKFAVHRGMFHSLPAAMIASQITFLSFGADDPLRRYFMASAVMVGFLTHLILDEIWSVRLGMFGPKFKKSFGTALKFYGPELWPNAITYGIAATLGLASIGDAAFAEKWAATRERIQQAAAQRIQYFQPAFPQPGYQQPPPYPQPGYQPPVSQQQPWFRR